MSQDEARDLGRDYHRSFPDHMLIEVARSAALLFPGSKEDQLAYLIGYADARRQRDEYLQEVRS